MDFSSQTPRKQRAESIVPMINVVFLLLIFFLMTSELTRPDPFEVTKPDAIDAAPSQADPTMYMNAAGDIHFEGADGPDAIVALQVAADTTDVILLHADAQVTAKTLAASLQQLAQAGFKQVEIAVVPQ